MIRLSMGDKEQAVYYAEKMIKELTMRSKIHNAIGSIAALLAVLTIFFSIRPRVTGAVLWAFGEELIKQKKTC